MAQYAHVQDRILDALLARELISEEHIERARQLARADETHPSVSFHLQRLGVVTDAVFEEALSEVMGYPVTNLQAAAIPPKTLDLLSADFIIDNRVVPVVDEMDEVVIAMEDPGDIELVDNIRWMLGRDVVAHIATVSSIEEFIKSRYERGENLGVLLDGLTDTAIEVVDEAQDSEILIQEEVDAAPVVKLINHVLIEAVRRGASDIHFEFFEHIGRVRFRIDGALIPVMEPPVKFARAIISRLKIMAELDIGERRLPQDGRTRLRISNREIDFRVSTLPCQFHEAVVLRILDKSAVTLDLDALGVEGTERAVILDTIRRPHGMLLVTGPTGSGKTTTLYSLLSRMNQVDVNILTVEDPIEYDFRGIRQVAVQGDIGRTFAETLRSFMRQDPDIIMIGEIRDEETANIAVRAALTGHMVLSTLHTNDAASAVTRLAETGIERFNIASAVSAVVAQRLVRKVCSVCKEEVQMTDAQLHAARLSPEEAKRITFYRGAGCTRCNNTGYRGRTGIYEVLPITTEIGEMILASATATDIKQAAIRGGMRTLRMNGLRRLREGVTTLDEIIKHTAL